MVDPLFWLGLSFLLVAVSLTAVLLVLVPAVRELSRAARSVEKLCDTISRELPPTLESIRLTSLEITELTDDVAEGVQQAGRVVQQVDQSLSGVRQQAQRVHMGTRSLMAGVQVAWSTLTRAPKGRSGTREGRRPGAESPRRRLPASHAPAMETLTHAVPPSSQLPAGSPPTSPSPQNGSTPAVPRPDGEATPTQGRDDA